MSCLLSCSLSFCCGLGLCLRTGLSLALSLSVAVIVGDNSSVVGLVDVISDLIGFQNVYQSLNARVT